jgi:tetratricopeptide (TPR) repeat protein
MFCSSFHRLSLIAFCIGFLGTALPAQTQQQAPWNLPAFSADAKEIIAAAAAIPAKQYAKVTIFTQEQLKIFDASGKYTTTARTVYRVETKEAIARWGTVRASWSPWRGPRPEIRARVIEPDGTVVALDPGILTESPMHDQRPVLYEDSRSYSGPLPGIEVGSIVEEEQVWTDSSPQSSHGGAWRYYLGDDGMVLHSLLELRAPASVGLKYKLRKSPAVTVTQEKRDGITTLRFEQGSLDPLEPAEGNLPADFDQWATIDYGTGESWNAVAGGYYGDIKSAIRPSDVRPLLEGTSKLRGQELMRQLVTNLHSKVRYTGLEFGSSQLIPHAAGDTLKTGYGDCKDKAVVLVSALQAAGIPAQVALLYVRGDDDVSPEVPGIGMFDHAIVYVPGKAATWIDATAEFYEPGSLPWVDQGRLALLVGPETKELVRTPIDRPEQNTSKAVREFRLSEYGPAQIVETLEGTGEEAAILRSNYGQEETKETHDELARYVKDTFLADDLTGVTRNSGSDLSKTFQLRLEVAKGKRGSSDLNQAIAAIRMDGILWGFPNNLLSDDGTDKPDQPGWKARKNDIEIRPFATEWRYRIVPPPGFDAPVLPKDSEQAIGPGKLTQHYTLEADGSVTGMVRFDSGKARYTPDELKSMQQAANALRRADAVIISFPQKGAKLLSEGKAREALASYADLIKLHPSEGLHHIQRANALLQAGFGEEARKEALRATDLDPKNAEAWSARGWILEHDAIGRRFGSGFDLKGAVAAYRKAIELDPKEWSNYADLGILLEFDEHGQRYSAGADLDGAAAEYRALKQADKDRAARFDDNLLYVLLYRRKWEDALQMCDSLPSNANRTAIRLAITAAREGSQAALTEAARRESNDSTRSDLLVSAANMLLRLRLYAPALDFLNAAAAGQADSSRLRKRIELIHNVRPYDEVLFPESDPRRIVQNYILDSLNPDSPPEYIFKYKEVDPVDRKDELLGNALTLHRLRQTFENQDIPPGMAADLVLSNMQMSVEGDDQTGFRIRASGFGEIPGVMLVARWGMEFHLVVFDDFTPVGREVLRRLAANDLKGAKIWLDWTREEVHLNSGDDPLGGRIFPRFWTRGDDPDPARMKLAALALLTFDSGVRDYIDFLKSARAQAKESERERLDLLLTYAAGTLKDWKLEEDASVRLLSANPGSDSGLWWVVTSCLHTKDWEIAEKAIAKRFSRIPDDPVAIRVSSFLADGRGDFAQAKSLLRPLIDKNRALMRDFNDYTWNAVLLGKVSEEDVSILQRAINENSDYGEIHTLACLYAEAGKTKEARELLLRAMNARGLDLPNEEIWYGFGRIAEAYGLPDVALALYQRVGKTDDWDLPPSTYNLARSREKGLQSRVSSGGD